MPLYAKAGIPEAWLVDINSDRIFVYRNPTPEGYQSVRAYYRGDSSFRSRSPQGDLP